jgi:erythromycin esterase
MLAMRSLRTMVTLSVVMLGPVPCTAQNDSTADRDRSAVLQWARSSLSPLSTVKPGAPWSDLDPLLRMIGDAPLVATSEAVHMGAEPLEFRNRLFQYLVEKKGFTAIALESGIVEGRYLHDYVLGRTNDLNAALANGLTWNFDRLPQNAALLRWVREYNADPRHTRKLTVYGFDVPANNPQAKRGANTELMEALKYLQRVDAAAATAIQARGSALIGKLRFDMGGAADAPGYDRLSVTERDTLTAVISDLVVLLERKEAAYTAASSQEDYQWGYRAALAARQKDNCQRQLPPPDWQLARSGHDANDESVRLFVGATNDTRDRAQADNLDWIVKREGANGKVLIFASRYHLSAMPVTTRWGSGATAARNEQQVAGTYLRRRFGARYVNIGNLISKGAFGCGDFQLLPPAPQHSIDGLAGELVVPRFVLDVRTAPPAVKRWLDREHQLGSDDEALLLKMGQAFDILFYLDTVSAACPATH